MAIEKIMWDVQNVENSSFVYNGFQQNVLKLLGLPTRSVHGAPIELNYNEVIDNFLKRPEVKTNKELRGIKNRQTVISDYMKNPDNYDRLPMILKNAVVDIYYEKDELPKQQNVDAGYIKSLETGQKIKFPLLVNMLYGNFKHDPNPQVFAMFYDRVHNLVEGFNLRYLSLPELRKIMTFAIKYPNVDMYYFYYGILKPYAVSKALGMKMGDVRRLSPQTVAMKLGKASANLELKPYKKYPMGTRQGMKNYGGQRMFGDVASKKNIGYGSVNNLLLAYRKYKLSYSTFFNVPIDFFNEPEEE